MFPQSCFSASSDEDQEEDVSFNPSRESSFQGVFQKAKPENVDDTCSDATEEDFLSEYENDENSFDGGETSNQDEVEAEDEDDQEDSSNGEDGSVSSDSGASSISSDDSNDESSDDEELQHDVSADQEDSEEQVKKVIVDWGDVSSDNHSTDVISRVASDADENDNDSMSAEEIEDLIRKPQASDMVSAPLKLTCSMFNFGFQIHWIFSNILVVDPTQQIHRISLIQKTPLLILPKTITI